jgi:hypothetical protein
VTNRVLLILALAVAALFAVGATFAMICFRHGKDAGTNPAWTATESYGPAASPSSQTELTHPTGAAATRAAFASLLPVASGATVSKS